MFALTIVSLSVLTLILSDFGQKVMRYTVSGAWERRRSIGKGLAAVAAFLAVATPQAFAAGADEAAGEASLKLPDLSQVQFLGVDGHKLLMIGILFCIFGLLFGLVIYTGLKNLPVHRAMGEISQLIWETCKTYLVTQGKFLLLLWVFIAAIIAALLRMCCCGYEAGHADVAIILFFSLVGIAGSYGVAWFGIRVNTFANSRTAFASLRGQGLSHFLRFPCAPG